MNAGALRHRVTVKQRTITQNSIGEPVKTWSDYLSANANIEPLRGKEFIEGIASQSQVTHKVRLRYRTGIVPTMRVYFCGRMMEIMYVINVGERNREINLFCKELFTDG
jgi:SPP1 family predicted phage head-tail adaptor